MELTREGGAQRGGDRSSRQRGAHHHSRRARPGRAVAAGLAVANAGNPLIEIPIMGFIELQ